MSPLAREVEAGRGDDDVGLQLLAGFQQDALLGEAVDLVGDDGGLAGLDALEQVAVGNERDALPPRPVLWREVGRDVVILAEIGFDRRQQILLRRFRLLKGLAGEGVLVEQDLAAAQPYDMEMGAGTFHPATVLRALGPDPWACAYVQPCRRPTDGRYGENPNRLGPITSIR